jgi:hypothetical protein
MVGAGGMLGDNLLCWRKLRGARVFIFAPKNLMSVF